MIILQNSVMFNIFLVFMIIFMTLQHVPHPPQSWDPSFPTFSLLWTFWFYSTFSQAHSLGLSWSPPNGRLQLQTSEWNKIWAHLMWLFSPSDQHDNIVNGNTIVLETWLLLRRRELGKMWERCCFKICMYPRSFIHLLTSILGKGIWHYSHDVNMSHMTLFLYSLDNQGGLPMGSILIQKITIVFTPSMLFRSM